MPLCFGYVVHYFTLLREALAWLLLGWGFCLFLAGGDEVWSRFIDLDSFSTVEEGVSIKGTSLFYR